MLHFTTFNKLINRIFQQIYSDIFCVKTRKKKKKKKIKSKNSV